MLTKTLKLSDLKAICHMAEMHLDMLKRKEGKTFPRRDETLLKLSLEVQTSWHTNWTIENDVATKE